jgi:hypothetical protein|tara:strand:+ start:655 stop:1368 length:714 start_codon:yes stop_codon:yes gene_type:complete
MSDENKTETVQEETKQEEVVEEVKETKEPKEDSQALIDKTIKDRLHRQKRRTLEDLGVSDLDEAKEIIARSKEAEEKRKLEAGKFEEVRQSLVDSHKKELQKLQDELRGEKIDKQLIQSASNNRAINPNQVKDLLKDNVRLNEEGKAEILDKDGTTRYNKEGKPLSIDEFVSEFITQNAHFQVATPSGSGSVSNVGKVNAQTFNLSDLDMNNPDDRKKYAELRKQRNAQPTVINLNK